MHLRPFALLLSSVVLIATLGAQEPAPGVRIGLTYAPGTRPGVYILPLRGAGADSVRAIVARDLDHGDRVAVIAPEGGVIPTGPLNYALYQRLGAAAVLQMSMPGDGSLQVALHELATSTVRNSQRFVLPQPAFGPAWRLAVHRVADEVERWVTGQQGVAASRVLFVRGGTLWQVDADGENAMPVPGVGAALGPTWHPNGTLIAWTELGDGGSRILMRDLASGRTSVMSGRAAANLSPAFAPDGAHLAYAAGNDGTDIVVRPLAGDAGAYAITAGQGSTNAQPTFSPDGRRVAFTTSRLGRNEIYISDSDGANPELLTTSGFGDQLYRSDPSWSPDGRAVAFSTQIEGRFQVATIALRDRFVKQHTSEGVNEDPSWAPDARHLVFTSNRGGSRQLWVLDTESGRMRQLTRGPVARMAAWGPRVPAAR
jgi:TolB protein